MVTIVTHNSKFHADDVFAVATLFLVLEKESKTANVIRTRDTEIAKNAEFVLDVGGVYNPEINRFDHHQDGGAGERTNGIPFASFGLVWKKFGEELCGSMEVSEDIDQRLVQIIDAGDNGIETSKPIIENVYSYEVHDLISAFNPSWKESQNDIDSIFIQVTGYAKILISREIKKTKDRFEARDIVLNFYNNAEDKRVIVLDSYYPANDFLNKFPEPLFIISPKEDGTWVMFTIKENSETFIDRKPLPKSWAGKMGEELEKITGVKGSIFCHINLFVAVAETKEAILKLAELALKE